MGALQSRIRDDGEVYRFGTTFKSGKVSPTVLITVEPRSQVTTDHKYTNEANDRQLNKDYQEKQATRQDNKRDEQYSNVADNLTSDKGVLVITSDVRIFRDECIGSGSFGTVFKGELNGDPCAVKMFYPVGLQAQMNRSSSLERFQKECEHLQSFKHPNLVQHLATRRYAKTGHQVLALELMDCNLRQFVSESEIPLETQRSLSHDIASALEYIHSREIVHTNLCGDNILLNCKGVTPVAKVCDFGMFNNKRISLLIFKQSEYLPPEATEFEWFEYDYSFDIFSFGVIMIQIARHLPTITAESRHREWRAIDSANPLKAIIESCLNKDKEYRPSAKELRTELTALEM